MNEVIEDAEERSSPEYGRRVSGDESGSVTSSRRYATAAGEKTRDEEESDTPKWNQAKGVRFCGASKRIRYEGPIDEGFSGRETPHGTTSQDA